MSGLDRAFIRAYTKHQPSTAMGPSHVSLPVRGLDAAVEPTRPVMAAPDSNEASISYMLVDPPHASVVGPHWEQASPARRQSSTATTESARPHSLMEMLAADWAGPAYEVDQFGWTSPITDLVAQGGFELDAVAHKILSAARGGGQVVAIGSAEAGAGGTTLLLCLAQRLAAMQLRAALVDADFTAPALAHRLGMSPAFGWEDIVAEERSLCDVLIQSVADGLTLLPLRGPVSIPQRLTEDLYWHTTLDALRGRYRLVLLDVGILDESVDLPWMRVGCGIDAAIVVGRAEDEERGSLAAAVRHLCASQIDVLGVVENFCEPEGERLARQRPRVPA